MSVSKTKVMVVELDGYNDWKPNPPKFIEVDEFTPEQVGQVQFEEEFNKECDIGEIHSDHLISLMGEEGGYLFIKQF